MDNLTHSLVGALLGRMGLKRLTSRAMPALILAANLPDIDSWVAPLWGEVRYGGELARLLASREFRSVQKRADAPPPCIRSPRNTSCGTT